VALLPCLDLRDAEPVLQALAERGEHRAGVDLAVVEEREALALQAGEPGCQARLRLECRLRFESRMQNGQHVVHGAIQP
jgi:hypothetical protein